MYRDQLIICAWTLIGALFITPHLSANILFLDYKIVASHQHQQNIFTQGLKFNRGTLYESSGLYGKSSLLKYSKNLQRIIYKRGLPRYFFAEGIAFYNDVLYLLTWKKQKVLLFSADDFSSAFDKSDSPTHHLEKHQNTDKNRSKKQFLSYVGEGWGLAFNGVHMIRSSGRSQLFFHNPDSFTVEQTIDVLLGNKKLNYLNELEWLGGKQNIVLANRWQDNNIYAINSINGKVIAILNLDMLAKQQFSPAEVLNGIAWNQQTNRLFVTGKFWDKLYELEVNWQGIYDE